MISSILWFLWTKAHSKMTFSPFSCWFIPVFILGSKNMEKFSVTPFLTYIFRVSYHRVLWVFFPQRCFNIWIWYNSLLLKHLVTSALCLIQFWCELSNFCFGGGATLFFFSPAYMAFNPSGARGCCNTETTLFFSQILPCVTSVVKAGSVSCPGTAVLEAEICLCLKMLLLFW